MKTEVAATSRADSPANWATVNPCIACAPLGAALVFKGIEGGMSVLHGSQGCATYIRRFLISHFREPVDIASSSFTEDTVVFGGEANLMQAVQSVYKTYKPAIIGIATTCLAETIGEDINMLVAKVRSVIDNKDIDIIPVHSPSYKDSHVGGYDSAIQAVLEYMPQHHATEQATVPYCGIIPCLLSPEDLRNIREIASLYSVPLILFPDISETLDAGLWNSYQSIPKGGTKRSDIARLSNARLIVDWTAAANGAGHVFAQKHSVPFTHSLPPIGIKATDAFCDSLSSVNGNAMPQLLKNERARLLDSYVDGHKYVSGCKVAICCDEPLVRALILFCVEIGMIPVLVATGRAENGFADFVNNICKDLTAETVVLPNADYDHIDAEMSNKEIHLCIGTSKFNRFAEKNKVPLVRVGFPVHDRFGAARMAHIGYKGTQQLFDRIVNALITAKQTNANEQWSYV